MNKEKNFVSAVVYVRNNENNIAKFIKELNKVLKTNFLKYEIIFVNDCSTDNTVYEIKKLVKTLDTASISIINMSMYQGKEIAMNAGVDLSIGDFVYQFDTILMDYDPNVIFDIYKKSLEEYDIVNAVPNKKRKVSSKLFYKIFNKHANLSYKLDTETFKIISRRAINRIYAINKTVPYRKAIEAGSGLRMANVEYEVVNNVDYKLDKTIQKERRKTAVNSLILFTDVSYKIALTLSLIMMLLVVLTGCYTVVIFLRNEAIKGWTTTMLFLAFGFFGIFLIFTIIIKYLSIILNLVFKKTDFLIESVQKIK